MANNDDLFAPPSQEEMDLFQPPSQEEMDMLAPPTAAELEPAEPVDAEEEEGMLTKSWDQLAGDSPFKALPREKFEEVQRIAQESSKGDTAKNLLREGFTFGMKSEGEAASQGIISEIDRALGYPVAKWAGGKENIEAALKEDPNFLVPEEYDQARLADELKMKLQAEKDPRTALASELAGSFLNPASWVGPAALTKLKHANKLRKAMQLAKMSGATGTAGTVYTAGKSLHKPGTPEFAKETAIGGGISAVAGPIFGAAASSKVAAPIALTAAAGGIGLPMLTGNPEHAVWGLLFGGGVGATAKLAPYSVRILNKMANSGKWNKLMDAVREGFDVESDEFAAQVTNKVGQNAEEASKFIKDFKDTQYQEAAKDITDHFMGQAKRMAGLTEQTEGQFAQFTKEVADEVYGGVLDKLKKASEEGKVVDPSELAQSFTDTFKTASQRYSGKSGVSELAAQDLADEMSRQFMAEMPQELNLKINQTFDDIGLKELKYSGGLPEEQLTDIQQMQPSVEQLQAEGFQPVGAPKLQQTVRPERMLTETKRIEQPTGVGFGQMEQTTDVEKLMSGELGEGVPVQTSKELMTAGGPTLTSTKKTVTPSKTVSKVSTDLQKVIQGKPFDEMTPMELNDARKSLNEVYRRRMLTASGEKRPDVDAGLFEDYRNLIKQMDELEEGALSGVDPITKERIPSEVSTLRKDWGKLKDIFARELKLDAGTIAKLEAGELADLSKLHRVLKNSINKSAVEPDYDPYVRVLQFLEKYKPEKAKELGAQLQDIITTAKRLRPHTENESLEVRPVLEKLDALRSRRLTSELPEKVQGAEQIVKEYGALEEIAGGFSPSMSTPGSLVPSAKAEAFVRGLSKKDVLSDRPTQQALSIIEKYNPELAKKMKSKYSYDAEVEEAIGDYRKKTSFGPEMVRPDTASILTQGKKLLDPRRGALPGLSIKAGKLERAMDKVSGLPDWAESVSKKFSYKKPTPTSSELLKDKLISLPDEIRLPLESAFQRGPSAVTATSYMLSIQHPQYRQILDELKAEHMERDLRKEYEEEIQE